MIEKIIKYIFNSNLISISLNYNGINMDFKKLTG